MSKEIQVIFLDDEESIIHEVQCLFVKEPYGVFATTKIEEAREALAQYSIKVVVSDYYMPELSGIVFLRGVKEQYPDTVKVLLTGHTDFSAAEEAVNIGEVYRFISKPWKTSGLFSTIRQCIEHYDLVAKNKAHEEAMDLENKKLQGLYEKQKEFTSTVSHELRTPLASIKMAIDLITMETVGPINSEQKDILGRAKQETDRLKRLINDIMDLTRIEDGKTRMVFTVQDINQVIAKAVDTHKDVAQNHGLYINMELDAQVPLVPFDNDRIIQVLDNLISNAIKFTKQGGITIKTQEKSLENHVLVSVIDTGKGIPQEDWPKLFQKFHQIESAEANEKGGTGLGLAICKEIITRHGGKIWVESMHGMGTSFNFILPIQERRGTEDRRGTP